MQGPNPPRMSPDSDDIGGLTPSKPPISFSDTQQQALPAFSFGHVAGNHCFFMKSIVYYL